MRAVDGVKAAEGGIFSIGRFVDEKGDPLTRGFAPNFIASSTPEPFETLTYVEGRPPRTAGEVAIDTSTADNENLKIGDTFRIAGDRAVTAYKIVGLQRLGDTDSGGASTAALTLPEAQRVTDKRGKLDGIQASAVEGVSARQLRARIDRALPPQVQVETGQEAAARQSDDIKSDLSFFTIVLLVFGGVTLLVGSFLIFNIFNITVAQRIRELGLLRTLGATRGQVLRSVVLEAAVIGVVGSVLGVIGGIGFAAALNAIFKAFGIDLPNTGTVIEPRTIIVGLLVGIIVTLVSALTPALRATRVSPMAALQEAELPESRRRGRVVTVVAVLLGVIGLGLMVGGLFGGASSSAAAILVGGGAVMTMFGVSLFSPRLVKPLASVAGWPLERVAGVTGRLARENTVRKPGRTATTAAALMIGLAVVVFVTVFAAGISESIGKTIDRNFQGDVILQNTDGFSPIAAEAAEQAGLVDGVETVSSLSYAGAERNGKDVRFAGVDPATADQVLSLDWKDGSQALLGELGESNAVVDDAWAEGQGIEVGDKVRVITPLEKRVSFTVTGSVEDNADLLGNVLISEAALRRDFGTVAPSLTLLTLAPGADADAVQGRDRRDAQRVVSHRGGAQPAGAQGEVRGADQRPRLVLLRAARPGDRDLAARDRHHADALDPRAHPRARDAPRRGDVAPPGAQDGALRGGHHGADRRRARDDPRSHLRRARVAAARRRGLRARLPVRRAAGAVGAGGTGGRAGGDLARPARGEARRAASARVRVTRTRTAADLSGPLLAGDKRALARAISLVENDDPEGWELVREVYPKTGRARVLGFTGPPGVGKSTLIGRLIENARAAEREVAVLSIDPSSPFTKGALLGDRIRLADHFLDPGVFIRSMASRGSLGGLSEAALQTALLMDASGKDDVFLETVGVGQAEVDIIDHADTVVLVLMPGSGDSIQALKAGVMEIPDVIAVNKCDHPLTDTMVREIRGVLSLGPQEGWRVPILKTEASRGEGIDELAEKISEHHAWITEQGTLAERRRRNLMNEVLALAAGRLRRAARGQGAR